jgi:hypothetical protein
MMSSSCSWTARRRSARISSGWIETVDVEPPLAHDVASCDGQDGRTDSRLQTDVRRLAKNSISTWCRSG